MPLGQSAIKGNSFGAIGRKEPEASFGAANPDQNSDVRAVLQAASDLSDNATVEACWRVIAANQNGTPGLQADLHVILNYFR